MKTRQDNDVTDRASVVYNNNDTKLLWPIKSSADSDENKIGQLFDWSYIFDLHWKWN